MIKKTQNEQIIEKSWTDSIYLNGCHSFIFFKIENQLQIVCIDKSGSFDGRQWTKIAGLFSRFLMNYFPRPNS